MSYRYEESVGTEIIPFSLHNQSMIEPGDGAINSYSGFNVTTELEREPIDQLQAFIAAKRIQEFNQEFFDTPGTFIPFVAGAFEALNVGDAESSERIYNEHTGRDEEKADFFQEVMEEFGLEGEVRITDDLWGDEDYWDAFQKLFDSGFYSRERCRENTLEYVDEEILEENIEFGEAGLSRIPPSIREQFGDWPACILYTPAEVAEALHLQEQDDVNLKIGPQRELGYDVEIGNFMDILHLTQPADLVSSQRNPAKVTPYIGEEDEVRILFGDTERDISAKLDQVGSEDYIYTMHEQVGRMMNPVVEKAVYAVETSRGTDDAPIVVEGEELYDANEVVEYARENGVGAIKSSLPPILEQHVTGRL